MYLRISPSTQPASQRLTRLGRRLRPLLPLLLLLLLLLPAGCQRPEDPVAPDPLLPRPQMVRLLTDLHLLEARVEASRLSPDSARALFQNQKAALLWQAQTTDTIFQRSYRYYGVHGQDLDELYQVVIDSLSRRERQLDPALTPAAQAQRRREGR